jgi:hypothetical protein
MRATDVFVEKDPDFGEFFAESFSPAFRGAPLGDLMLTRFDDGSGFVSIFCRFPEMMRFRR